MGRRVVGRDRLVPALAEQPAVAHDERTDRHFAACLGAPRQFDGLPHPLDVAHAPVRLDPPAFATTQVIIDSGERIQG